MTLVSSQNAPGIYVAPGVAALTATDYAVVDVDGDGAFDFIIDVGDTFYGADTDNDGLVDGMEDWTLSAPSTQQELDYFLGRDTALPDADEYFGAGDRLGNIFLAPSDYTEDGRLSTSTGPGPGPGGGPGGGPGSGGEAPGCPGGPDGHAYGDAWG